MARAQFPEKAANDAGFAVVLVSMFLLGVWFVRSGVMEDSAKHLAFFRKLALYGLPVGIGLGLLTGFIAMSHTPGDRYDGWGIARGLVMLGNLPACLGYVGLVVTMLHSRTALSRIRVLAPPGRMALTNYLMQSLVCMTVFYGFGLGHWGCRAPSRCCSWWWCTPRRSRSATGGWPASATVRWNGCGAVSRIGRCRHCASRACPLRGRVRRLKRGAGLATSRSRSIRRATVASTFARAHSSGHEGGFCDATSPQPE